MTWFNRYTRFFTLGLLLTVATLQSAQAAFPVKYNPGHYMRMAYDSAAITNISFSFDRIKNEPAFLGAQIRYKWKDLEPRRGVYNFSAVEAHLNDLRSMSTPKRLIIEIVDNGPNRTEEANVPNYLRTAEFEYGVYKTARGNVTAKRWNYNVQTRQIALFKALGARFDDEPYIEGIVLDETATGLAKTEWSQATYTPENQFAGLKRIMSGLKNAFPTTMCVQWINYFNGVSGQDNASKIAGLAEHAFQNGLGMGGPGVDPGTPSPLYPYHRQYSGSMPLVSGVEHDDWDVIDPATGSLVTVIELFRLAVSGLYATHVAWSDRNPQFTTMVIPTVRNMASS